MTLQVINSRGRLLLEVYRADVVPADAYMNAGAIHYSYRGDGCGGCGPREAIERTIAIVKSDAPSAKVIGEWPIP